jgi:hypothetical protein
MTPETDDFHENNTRKDDAAKFRCRSAAKPHLGAEIPLSSGSQKSAQVADTYKIFGVEGVFFGG